MDLLDLKPTEQFKLDIVNPKTGGSTGITFTIKSEDSDEAKVVARKIASDHLNANGKKHSVPELEVQALERIAACVDGWDFGDVEWRGVVNPEFSKETLLDVLRELEWVFEQVNEAVTDRANFIKG